MKLLLFTFFYCLVSSFIPFFPAEPYLAVVALQGDFASEPLGLIPLALVAAAGQMSGKLVFFYAGRGVIRLPRLVKKTRVRSKWTGRMARAQAWASRHRWGAVALCLLSAVVGLPPFAAVSALLGTLRMRVLSFFVVGLAGRTARFWFMLAAPVIALDWMPN